MRMNNEQDQVATVEAEVLPVARQAQALVVRNSEEHLACVDYLKLNKAAQKRVHDVLDPIVEAAHSAHKAATALRNRILDPILAGERQAKQVDRDWQLAEEEKRLAEQRALQAKADAQAAAERARLEKDAAKLKTPELKAARMEQAAAIVAPVVHVERTVESAGTTIKKTWKCRVVDAALVPREWMTVNQQALDAFARATKGAMPVAGCEMYEDSSISVRTK
jgi:hypothetical protein